MSRTEQAHEAWKGNILLSTVSLKKKVPLAKRVTWRSRKIPQEAPECISEHLKSQNFLRGHAPRTPYKVGPSGPGNSQTLVMPLPILIGWHPRHSGSGSFTFDYYNSETTPSDSNLALISFPPFLIVSRFARMGKQNVILFPNSILDIVGQWFGMFKMLIIILFPLDTE